VGSFRLSAFKQRGSIAAVFRCIPQDIPALDSLNVPELLSQLVARKARPDPDGGRHRHRQEHHAGFDARMAQPAAITGHILTIEDPIEFLFTNKKSVVNQREVGRDTQSLQIGLRTRCARRRTAS
jgi:twitching motility protein PilU